MVLGALLVLAVALTYWPLWRAGYIWDDRVTITANPVIIGPLGLREIWTTSAAQFYPLVLTTFWLEHALWGLAPMPYHLVNIAWHAACAVVLWQVLRLLQIPGAWLGAALWALHPVEVESVAWITEMKNTESAFFFLLSLFFFARWLQSSRDVRDWSYALCLVFAALALACKSSTVILPLVLCLCAWWIDGRWHWRNLLRTAPVFFLSAISSFLALRTVEQQGVNSDAQWATTWPERLAVAGDAIWFYLGKIVWPHPLSAMYHRWHIDTASAISYLPFLEAVLVFVFLWLKRESWARPWFFAYAYFLVALLPVLGLVNHFILRFSFVFDHFQYLASMGPLALAGAGLFRISETAPAAWKTGLATALLAVLGLISCQRASTFISAESLWTDTIKKNPLAWAAYDNLGIALAARGETDEAIRNYRHAIALNPKYADAHNNLGNALLRKNATADAITEYRTALALNPAYTEAHNDLGLALLIQDNVDEALSEFQTAVQLDPGYANAQNNLGLALERKGYPDDALAHYRAALKANPRHGSALFHLGNLLLQKGQLDEALADLQSAAALQPDDADIRNNLGGALLQKGRPGDALIQFQKAIALDPHAAAGPCNLGLALLQLQRAGEAVDAFRAATTLEPANAAYHCYLGMALMQSGHTTEAIGAFQKAVQLKPGYAEAQSFLQHAQDYARQHP